MSTIDREIKTRLENARDAVLKNRDKEKHSALQARYELLEELVEFLSEQAESDDPGAPTKP